MDQKYYLKEAFLKNNLIGITLTTLDPQSNDYIKIFDATILIRNGELEVRYIDKHFKFRQASFQKESSGEEIYIPSHWHSYHNNDTIMVIRSTNYTFQHDSSLQWVK